jgi:hypothetical protein
MLGGSGGVFCTGTLPTFDSVVYTFGTQPVPLLVIVVGTRIAHHSRSLLWPITSARDPKGAIPKTGNSRVGPVLKVAGSRMIT